MAAAVAGAAAAAYLTLRLFRGADAAYKRKLTVTSCYLPWMAVHALAAGGWLPDSLALAGGGAEPTPLPVDLLVESKTKWENLDALERHLGAQDMTSCEAMVVAHEQITALDPEYVNLFTVQVRMCMRACGVGGVGGTVFLLSP